MTLSIYGLTGYLGGCISLSPNKQTRLLMLLINFLKTYSSIIDCLLIAFCMFVIESSCPRFWKKLMEINGVKLKMSSSRHQKMDEESGMIKRMVEKNIRCYCSYHQDDWDELLPAVKFAYSSCISDDLSVSLFEVDLGWVPRALLDLISGNEVAAQNLEDFKAKLKTSLEYIQLSYKPGKAQKAPEAWQKYKTSSYKVGSHLWINNSLFKDAYSGLQGSETLGAKQCALFLVMKIIGRNVVKLDLSDHLKMHPAILMSHNTPYVEQLGDNARKIPEKPALSPAEEVDKNIMEKILAHKRKGRGYQFLTLMESDTLHGAVWKPSSDFVGRHEIITYILLKYMQEHNVLSQYH